MALIKKWRTARGFTLIELLLVIVVIGVALGIAMPSFVRSIQGHRLRTAGRSLVTVARYARSMAILKQTDLALTFNLDSGKIDLISSNTALPGFARVVDGVSLAYVDIKNDDKYTEGACQVPYRRNGSCRPFTVKIIDPRGQYIIVKVDALSSVKTMEYGND